MPSLPQNGQSEFNPPWHSGSNENQPKAPKQDDIHPQAPPEKEFGSHNDSQEARPGKHEDEWKTPSNR